MRATAAWLLIRGAAGIGKTALVEALIHEATARDAHVLLGGCYDLAVTPPYGPWIEAADCLGGSSSENVALTHLLAEPAAVGPAGSAAVVFSQVRDCLSNLAAQRPLVVILEDIHWADQASLELFRRLSRQASALPALLVATFRAEEISREDSLYAVLPLLVREAQADEIDLQPLDD